MQIIDISWTISEEMTVYKDKPEKKPAIKTTKEYSKDRVNESRLELDSHTGTHIDAQKHFIQNGKPISDVIISGRCKVINLTDAKDKITSKILQKYTPEAGDIILLKTANSKLSETSGFAKDFVYLDMTGAAFLASKKIKAIGIDYLGIERDQPNHETHKILLENNITIIEGLRLEHIEAGIYELICLPLKIKEGDASPARAILIKNKIVDHYKIVKNRKI